jgi:hypothetical protein
MPHGPSQLLAPLAQADICGIVILNNWFHPSTKHTKLTTTIVIICIKARRGPNVHSTFLTHP